MTEAVRAVPTGRPDPAGGAQDVGARSGQVLAELSAASGEVSAE